MRYTVRGDEAVVVEVIVVANAGFVFPPAAIGQKSGFRGVWPILAGNRQADALVHPIPHKSALRVCAGVEDVPVFFQAAG